MAPRIAMPAAATSARHVGDITCMSGCLRNHLAIGWSRRNRRHPSQACANHHHDRDHQVTHVSNPPHMRTNPAIESARRKARARKRPPSSRRAHVAQKLRLDERGQPVKIADQRPAVNFVRNFAAEQAVTACHFQVARRAGSDLIRQKHWRLARRAIDRRPRGSISWRGRYPCATAPAG